MVGSGFEKRFFLLRKRKRERVAASVGGPRSWLGLNILY